MPSYGFEPRRDSQAVVTALLSGSARSRFPRRIACSRPACPRRSPRAASESSWTATAACPATRSATGAATSRRPRSRSKAARSSATGSIDYLVLSFSIRPILTERMPIFRMPREEAVQLADAIETLFVDPRVPEDPFLGRPASDADPVEGERLYVTLGCRGCHIVGSKGGYYGPPLTDCAATAEAGLDLHVAQGAAALARRRALSRLRPDRPGRAATDRVHRDPAPTGGAGEGGEMKSLRIAVALLLVLSACARKAGREGAGSRIGPRYPRTSSGSAAPRISTIARPATERRERATASTRSISTRTRATSRTRRSRTRRRTPTSQT